MSKTLTVLRPLLGQLTRSQKQERDRIERELSTSGATKLKRVNKTELVGQTQLLHVRQRRLVMLVQQHRRLVDKIGSSVTTKDQPMKTHEDSRCGTLIMSFLNTQEKEGDGYSAFHKTPQMTDAKQRGNAIASPITTQDGATIDLTTMATKHKDPPDGSSSGMGKKQKTSSVFRAPYKDTVAVHGSGGDENTKTFSDGMTMTCELWGISEDSEMCCHGNLGRNSPRCFPMTLGTQSSKMAQNRSTVVESSNAISLPACTQTAAATPADNASQSISAATCRQMTTSSIGRPDGLSQQTLIPAAVVSWKPQPGPSM